MRWLLVCESAFFTAAAGYFFVTGMFWTGWAFTILAVIYTRQMTIAWADWEANQDLQDLLERARTQ